MHRDPFDVLGLEPRFDLDVAVLERRVRELSRALHPDRYATAPAGQRRRALSEAIGVNEAQRALKDPIRRGELLCQRIFGDASAPGARSAEKDERETAASPRLLAEVMELREALAEARHKQDTAAVAKLKEQVSAREVNLLDELAELFARGLCRDVPTNKPSKAVERATLEAKLGELRYVRRFLDEVALLEDEVA